MKNLKKPNNNYIKKSFLYTIPLIGIYFGVVGLNEFIVKSESKMIDSKVMLNQGLIKTDKYIPKVVGFVSDYKEEYIKFKINNILKNLYYINGSNNSKIDFLDKNFYSSKAGKAYIHSLEEIHLFKEGNTLKVLNIIEDSKNNYFIDNKDNKNNKGLIAYNNKKFTLTLLEESNYKSEMHTLDITVSFVTTDGNITEISNFDFKKNK